jgi:hypothetical protein
MKQPNTDGWLNRPKDILSQAWKLLELADICEEVANTIEDGMTAG